MASKKQKPVAATALWGIDLGGTKIEGVVLESAANPLILARLRLPTEAVKGYQHILGQIKLVVEQLQAEVGFDPLEIGVGTPGTRDPKSGLQKNSNTVCLNGHDLQADLTAILGVPTKLANDANCFALAEDRMGIVPDIVPNAKLTFGIIMGTGVGGGLVMNGQVWNGGHGIGGEWGHNFLDENGGPCYCGLTGCIETVISGPSLERYYRELSGKAKPLATIVQDHEAGHDRIATKTVERLLVNFGKAVASLVNILDPDALVIGGGVGNIDLLYTEGPRYIVQHLFNNEFNTPLLKPKLGDSAGVFGAAYLVG
jgi:predicted NBD/HSP70 family sugar kinase